MKRALILPLLLLAVSGCESSSPPAVEPPPEPLTPVEYLREHAVAVRSIDHADENYADLQPLKAMIGNARIVSLGEATHGDGATFRAKARLVKFLHREMGFDVLAWEGGFWDVPRAWSLVEAGAPVGPAMRRGMSGVWSRSAQVAPVLEYVKATSGTARPLELVGIDMQFTWDYDADPVGPLLPADLRALLERHGSQAAGDPRFATFEDEIARMTVGDWATDKPTPAEQEAFRGSLAFLRAELVRLGGGTGGGELAYWVQLLESLEELQRGQLILTTAGGVAERTAYANVRDRQMGRNLAWLANRGFPGRKIIVWAATGHVMRNAGPFEGVASLLALGDHARTDFGDAVYTIGFTSHGGTWGIAGDPTVNLQPMGPQSLEARFIEAGMDLGIVDLRNPAKDGEWLRGSFASRPVRHLNRDYAYSQSLDALMFIRTMTPSTGWTPGS